MFKRAPIKELLLEIQIFAATSIDSYPDVGVPIKYAFDCILEKSEQIFWGRGILRMG